MYADFCTPTTIERATQIVVWHGIQLLQTASERFATGKNKYLRKVAKRMNIHTQTIRLFALKTDYPMARCAGEIFRQNDTTPAVILGKCLQTAQSHGVFHAIFNILENVLDKAINDARLIYNVRSVHLVQGLF